MEHETLIAEFPLAVTEPLYDPSFQEEFFDGFSGTYALSRIFSFGLAGQVRRRALSLINISPGSVACDLMCGDGDNIALLSKKNCRRIYAVDLSPRMLDKARQRFPQSNVELICDNALLATIPERSVDVVTCTFGLKTLPEEQQLQLIRKIHRVLRPGGQFVLAEISLPEKEVPLLLSTAFFKYGLNAAGLIFRYPYIRRQFLWEYIRAFGSVKTIAGEAERLFPHTRSFSWYGGMVTGISGRKN